MKPIRSCDAGFVQGFVHMACGRRLPQCRVVRCIEFCDVFSDCGRGLRKGKPQTAADTDYSRALEEELQQLALQKATIDDLDFAYQLQRQEVMRASAENAGPAVSPRMVAAETDECLQRRHALDAQVSEVQAQLLSTSIRSLQCFCNGQPTALNAYHSITIVGGTRSKHLETRGQDGDLVPKLHAIVLCRE